MKISIEKAVEITESCICCNSIKEIEEKLNEYNKKHKTDYTLEIKCFLFTTNNCGRCNLVKKLIQGQNLNIIVKEASEQDIKYLDGNKVGDFIASNLKLFK